MGEPPKMEDALSAMVRKVLVNPICRVPSLYELALVGTAAVIFNQDDIKDTLPKVYKKFRETRDKGLLKTEKEWKMFESKAAAKLPNSCLPETVKQDLLALFYPMTLEMLEWIKYHSRKSKYNVSYPKQFCWTWQGKLDKKRTVEFIVKDDSLCMEMRYRLACLYCLEEDIYALWEQMHASNRNTYFDTLFTPPKQIVGFKESTLVYFWSNYCLKRCSFSLSKYLVREAVLDGNVAATKFFLPKLEPRRRQFLILRKIRRMHEEEPPFSFSRNDHYEVWRILISEMKIEMSAELFAVDFLRILRTFLRTQREMFFMGIVTQAWNFLTPVCFASLLNTIFTLYEEGYKSMYFRKLFIEFWKEGSDDYKRFVSTQTAFGAAYFVRLIQYSFPFVSKIRIFKRKASRFCMLLKIGNSRPPFGFDEEKWKFLKIMKQQRMATKRSLILYKESMLDRQNNIWKKRMFYRWMDLVDRILSD